MAWGDKLVARGTSFGLRALRGKQVPEAGRAANQLSGSGNFEALGDGLFGLLHGGKVRKQRRHAEMARGMCVVFRGKENLNPRTDIETRRARSRSGGNETRGRLPRRVTPPQCSQHSFRLRALRALRVFCVSTAFSEVNTPAPSKPRRNRPSSLWPLPTNRRRCWCAGGQRNR